MLGKSPQSAAEPLLTKEQVAEEEKRLVFDSFTAADAMKLGAIMLELSEEVSLPFAFEIELNGLVVFKCMPQGTNKFNDLWMEKKLKTVHIMEQSTMMVWIVSHEMGFRRPPEMLPLSDIIACGGGFPIRVKGAGVIGAIASSGPGDQNDHEFIVEALTRFLARK